jgi:uncharacterized SAM-binding protein YcdF (DUF218 family)
MINNGWDMVVWFFWAFVWIAYLMVVFSVIVDVFRDHTLSGWGKDAWTLFIVFVPFLAVIVYLIARGRGMNDRQLASQAPSSPGAADDYYASVIGGGRSTSATDEITRAKSLLDSGAITSAEYERLKASALA